MRTLMEPGGYRFTFSGEAAASIFDPRGPRVRCEREGRRCLIDLGDEGGRIVANAGFTRLELEEVRIVAGREAAVLTDLAVAAVAMAVETANAAA